MNIAADGSTWWDRRVVARGLPVLVVAVAGALRLIRLGEPRRAYFDEGYYAEDAHEYLRYGVEQVRAVHPPLGKWLIAAGIEGFGFTPFGWRISAAVAGTVTVLLVYLCGRRLCTRWAAGLAALLIAVDGLAFTMSRIAMLDIFAGLFTALAFWLLLMHREARAAGQRSLRWLLLTGLALGCAVATKWTGLVLIAAAGAFVLAGEVVWARRRPGPWWKPVLRSAGPLFVCFVILPATVYLASYGSWFANVENTSTGRRLCAEGDCASTIPEIAAAWWGEQGDILRFHRNLVPKHPYRSSAWGWPVLRRPVLYYFERCEEGDAAAVAICDVAPGNRAKILGIGNPAVWWPALMAYPALGYLTVRRRDWRAATILWFLIIQWVPWALSPTPGYLFYMTPVVAFMCLALALVAERAATRRRLRWVPAALAVLAVATFAYFYPVYAAVEAPRDTIDQRIWIDSWR